MESSIFKQAARFLREKKQNHFRAAAFVCLALAVASGTIGALTLTGQAMTHKEKVLNCRYVTHQHTESCYDEDGNLICGYADYVVHTHNADCYEKDGDLVCQLPEIEEHHHTEECWTEEEVLVCGLEESPGHIHSEACYTQTQGALTCTIPEHLHSEACYGEDGSLICGMEEHQHGEGCYAWEQTLTCGLEEGAGGHTHTAECYQKQKVLTCGQLELHTHDENCYETDENGNKYLVCEIPVLERHIHEADCFDIIELTGDEIEQRIVEEAKEKEEEEGEAGEGGTEEGTEETGEDAETVEGEDGTADGTETPEGEDGVTDETETAAGEAEEPEETFEMKKEYESDRFKVTAEYNETAKIPEEAELLAEEITAESDSEHFAEREAQIREELGSEEISMDLLLKIGFYINGEEIEPEDKVRITIQLMDNGCEEGDPITVVHFGPEEPEVLNGTCVREDEEGNLVTSFQTDSFSEFALGIKGDAGKGNAPVITYLYTLAAICFGLMGGLLYKKSVQERRAQILLDLNKNKNARESGK